jgi:hypothetical protein
MALRAKGWRAWSLVLTDLPRGRHMGSRDFG